MNYKNLSNDELINLRKQKQIEVSRNHNMQLAKKILLNSCYGAMSNEFFAFYSDTLAESITLSGQLSIRWIANKLNLYLNKICGTTDVDYVIAIDTDSNYLNVEKLVNKFMKDVKDPKEIVDFIDKMCKEALEPYIEKSYQELADMMNAYEQKMRMKRETIADIGIWTGKKKYILNAWDIEGVRFNEPQIKMTGIEAIRSNTPFICREYIKKSIKLIINDDEKKLHDYIKECRLDFSKKRFDEIGKPSGINGLGEYADKYTVYKKGTPWHVRAALLYNKMIKDRDLHKKYPLINEGEKIRTCYMKVPNPFHENAFAVPDFLPEELKLDSYIDYDKQFEVTFLNPLDIILKTIDWTHEKVHTLDEFFS